MDFRRRPTGSNGSSSLTISGSSGGSKFTGFRHVHRSDGAVVVKGSFSEASLSSNGSGSWSTTSAPSSSSANNNSSSSAIEAGVPSATAYDGISSSNAQKLSLGVTQQLAKATAALKERELVSNNVNTAATTTGTAGRHPSSTDIGAAFKSFKRESAQVSPSVSSSNRSIRSNSTSTSSNSSQSGEQQLQHPSTASAAAAAVGNLHKTSADFTESYLGLQSLQGHNQGKNQGGGWMKRTISDLTNTNSNNGCGYDNNNNNSNQYVLTASRTGSGSGSGSPEDNEDHRRCVNILYLAATAAAANDA